EGEGEFWNAKVEVHTNSAFLKAIQDALSADVKPLLDVWMSHGDNVSAIPADFTTVANSATCQYAVIANQEKRFYG
ncbi:GMP synthase (glutamine-hydrolyzing), partial [Psychromonas arctica]